ncbi:MAG TPA: hypothetical protein VL326_05170 [Kofleriaceae bacterium]|jgi:hypothetical protein|nr:hypothetical protein [Kofleriaceae bacterium]
MRDEPTDDLRADADDLRTEALVFGRYLVGRDLNEALIERYCRANEELFAHEAPDAAVEYARRHPWAIPMLDAAEGVAGMRGGEPALLRKKLLVMTAIVETTPEYVAQTEPRSASLPALAVKLGVAGARTALHAAAGLALLAMVKRRG